MSRCANTIILLVLVGCSSMSDVQPGYHSTEIKGSNNMVIRIYSCRSLMLYIIKDNKLYFPNGNLNYDDDSEYNFVMEMDPYDFKNIQKIASKFVDEDGNLVLNNRCILDGSAYKILIERNDIELRRVYISNYFDYRFNEIALIANKYLSKSSTQFEITIDEGTNNKSYIRYMVEEQNRCGIKITEESKMNDLYSWCEPPSWESMNF